MNDHLTIQEAVAFMPGSDNTEHTVSHAMRCGVMTPIGRVKLRRIKHGNRNYTTRAWIKQFERDLEAAFNQESGGSDQPQQSVPTPAINTERRRTLAPRRSPGPGHDDAKKYLALQGLA